MSLVERVLLSSSSTTWGWGFDDLSMGVNLRSYPLTTTNILTVIPKRNLLLDRKVLSFLFSFFLNHSTIVE